MGLQMTGRSCSWSKTWLSVISEYLWPSRSFPHIERMLLLSYEPVICGDPSLAIAPMHYVTRKVSRAAWVCRNCRNNCLDSSRIHRRVTCRSYVEKVIVLNSLQFLSRFSGLQIAWIQQWRFSDVSKFFDSFHLHVYLWQEWYRKKVKKNWLSHESIR